MQAKHNSYVMGKKVTAFREPPYIHVTCVVLDLAFKFSNRAVFFSMATQNFRISQACEFHLKNIKNYFKHPAVWKIFKSQIKKNPEGVKKDATPQTTQRT